MEFSEQVLILQVGKFREADLWVRFLSPTRGLLSAFAFGGSRSKRRFAGCLDICNRVLFRVQATRHGGYLALQEGVLIKGPRRLREDWSRLGLAGNCIKFLQAFDVGAEGAAGAYALLDQSLQLLEERDILPALLPLFFRLRLAFEQGYAIDLRRCSVCGIALDGQEAYFAVREGVLTCRACASQKREMAVALGPEALDALAAVTALPPAEWGAVVIDAEGRRQCARAIDGFIEYHVGLSWENGRFARI